MRLRLVILLGTAATLVACGQPSQPTPKTDDEKAAYALGVIMTKQIDIGSFDLTDQEIALVKAGLADGARDKSSLDDDALKALVPKLQELQGKRVEALTKKNKEAGVAYLAKAAAESGAKKTASGMIYTTIKEGTGATPKATDTVKVNYEGKLIDGKVFDSTTKPGREPATFPLSGVIGCWTEGVQQMKVGGKAHLVCPAEIAYGDEGRPPQIRGGSTLAFDVELLDIMPPEAAAPAATAPQMPAGHPAVQPKK